jgi:hypothetical protein
MVEIPFRHHREPTLVHRRGPERVPLQTAE